MKGVERRAVGAVKVLGVTAILLSKALFNLTLSQTFASLAHTIRMVEKTLKASPLSNTKFERSEYPRHNPNRYVHLEEVPEQ